MKVLALVLVVALRLYSVVVQADEEVRQKFKQDVEKVGKECYDVHPIKEDDVKALKAFEIPPNQEGKCFIGCVYTKFGLINGNEYNPTQFKTKLREWLQKYPEKLNKIEKMLDTCTAKIKEAHPNGGDECTLSPSIIQCFHSHKEETEEIRKFLGATYDS